MQNTVRRKGGAWGSRSLSVGLTALAMRWNGASVAMGFFNDRWWQLSISRNSVCDRDVAMGFFNDRWWQAGGQSHRDCFAAGRNVFF